MVQVPKFVRNFVISESLGATSDRTEKVVVYVRARLCNHFLFDLSLIKSHQCCDAIVWIIPLDRFERQLEVD